MINWWQSLLIKKRLSVVMLMITGLIAFQLFVLMGSIGVFQSIRTLVAGEGYWSQSQKSAIINLTNFAMSGNRRDLEAFEEDVAVLLADKKARLELEKEDANYEVLFKSLVEGKNHPDDVRFVIIFLKLTYNFDMVQSILREWEYGDNTFGKVIDIAKNLEAKVAENGPLDVEEFKDYFNLISQINNNLTIAQNNFSRILLDSARATEEFITISLLFIVLSTFSLAYLLCLSAVKTFNTSIKAIKYSIGQAAEGNYDALLSLKKYEDIGSLSLELNRLLRNLQEQMLGRLTAEVSEARLSILADAMPQIVSIRNNKAEVEFLNQRAWDFFNFKTNNLKEIDLMEYVHPDDVQAASVVYLETRSENKIIEAEFRLRNKEGKYIWFLSRSVPVLNRRGDVVRWYGSLTDIDAQKNAHKQLLNAVEMRDQFLSIASHELKTPLTSHILQLQLRRRYLAKKDYDKFTPEKIEKMVNDDQKQVNRLVRLVDDMLDISRIRTGKMDLEYSVFDLRELTAEIASRLNPQFEVQNCKIIILDSQALIGKWDRYRIEQVITNLLTNALKYGNSKDVEVSFFKNDSYMGLKVKDQGIGIAPKDQKRVFDLFERVITPTSVTGLGLGLFIVKQIIEAHNGRIYVESKINSGTTFTVELPSAVVV